MEPNFDPELKRAAVMWLYDNCPRGDLSFANLAKWRAGESIAALYRPSVDADSEAIVATGQRISRGLVSIDGLLRKVLISDGTSSLPLFADIVQREEGKSFTFNEILPTPAGECAVYTLAVSWSIENGFKRVDRLMINARHGAEVIVGEETLGFDVNLISSDLDTQAGEDEASKEISSAIVEVLTNNHTIDGAPVREGKRRRFDELLNVDMIEGEVTRASFTVNIGPHDVLSFDCRAAQCGVPSLTIVDPSRMGNHGRLIEHPCTSKTSEIENRANGLLDWAMSIYRRLDSGGASSA